MEIRYFLGICSFVTSVLWISSCGENIQPEIRNDKSAPREHKQNLEKPESEKPKIQQNTQVVLENAYLLIKKNPTNGALEYLIKQTISKPIFIQNDGKIIENSDVSLISSLEFEKNNFVLLPETHWFSRHFLNNPFKKNSSLTIVRPSIWGFLVDFKKSENKGTLWLKGAKIDKKEVQTLSESELRKIFPAYDAKVLGQGGVGKVYDVSYDGISYALKENSSESYELERLQFTDAVVKIFASFSMNNQDYLVMEKGITDLQAMDEKAQKLPKDVVLDAIKRFTHLLRAEKYFGISNNDIKPGNIIVTQNQRPMMIDLSESTSRGYHGTEGELLARALLGNQINQRLASNYISLDRYFDFDGDYRNYNIASPYFLKYWYPQVCAKELNNDPRCKVNSFEEVFALFSKAQLQEIGERINAYYTRTSIPPKPDNSGTHDSTAYGPYRTGLPLPNLRDASAVNWQEFYNQKDKIGASFCVPLFGTRETFRRPYYAKHQAYCRNRTAGQEYRYVRNFTGFNDPQFKEWILDAYAPSIMVETFKLLARENPISSVYPLIFKTELNLNDPDGIGKPLWELYQYEP